MKHFALPVSENEELEQEGNGDIKWCMQCNLVL